MDDHMKRSGIVVIVLAMLVVAWPALYNGQPLYFSDTSAYVRGANAGVERITGFSTAWSENSRRPSVGDGSSSPRHGGLGYESLSSIEDKAVLSGRSVYYGALLYLGYVGGEFWLAVAIQALLLVSACIWTLRACRVPVWPYVAVVIALASVTPAAFFVSFAMPDMFAALAILACAVLFATGGELAWRDRMLWFLLLAFALLAHSAHVLVITCMVLIAAIAGVVRKRRDGGRAGLILVVSAILVALLGEAAFTSAVTRMVGAPPLRPPFLMARTIDDGPGYTYLYETCPQNGFVVCEFRDRLPLAADEFLWLRDPQRGVFAVVDSETRRLLSREQVRFFGAVLTFDMPGQVSASIRNSFRQATLLSLPEFQYPEKRRREFEAKLPEGNFERMRSTAAFRGEMPITGFSVISYVLAIAGISYLIYVSIRIGRRPGSRRLISAGVAWLIVLGISLNAIIVGSLSTPHHRYQARVIWLLPVIALIMDFERRQDWWKRLFGQGRQVVKADDCADRD